MNIVIFAVTVVLNSINVNGEGIGKVAKKLNETVSEIVKIGFNVTENPFKHGIIFQPEGIAALTKTSWTIAIHYDISNITASLTTLQNMFDQLRKVNEGNHSQVLLAHEHTLHSMFLQTWDEYSEVAFLAGGEIYRGPGGRRKRGYIWDRMLHGFSISTSSDMIALNERIDMALKQIGDIITQSQSHTSVMRNITGDMKDQQVQVQQLVRVTGSLMKAVFTTLTTSPKEMGILMIITYGTLIDALALIHYHLDHIQRIVTSLKQGKLEYALMPPRTLQKALAVISGQLPEELTLVLGTDQISAYYDTIMCTHLPAMGAVRGIMKVPVVERNEKYAVYRAIPFPHTLKSDGNGNNTRVLWTGPPQYIGISKDREKYVNLGREFTMEKCLKTSPRVCQDEYLISRDVNDHCLFQLQTERTGTEPREKCSYEQVEHDRTFIMSITDELWAISSVVGIRIQGHCMDLNKMKETSEATEDVIIPPGEHIITVPRHCTANIDGQWIPLRLQMQGSQYHHSDRMWQPTIRLEDYQELTKKSEDLSQLLKKGQSELATISKSADKKLVEIEALHDSIKNSLTKNQGIPQDIERLVDHDSWLTAAIALIMFMCVIYTVTRCVSKCQQRHRLSALRRPYFEERRRGVDIELLNSTMNPTHSTFIRSLPAIPPGLTSRD